MEFVSPKQLHLFRISVEERSILFALAISRNNANGLLNPEQLSWKVYRIFVPMHSIIQFNKRFPLPLIGFITFN